MVVYPPAKINLGLHITRRRDDGYHDLETVFLPVPLFDILEVNLSGTDHFTLTGIPLDNSGSPNLVQKALTAIRNRYEVPPLNIHLHKQIPAGSGLGGGSSDAAYTLKCINELCALDIGEEEMAEIALETGSDSPFFLLGQPAAGSGRGEVLMPVDVNLEGWHLLLVTSAIHVSTAWAYRQITPVAGRLSPAGIVVNKSPARWKGNLDNDFEQPVFEKWPELKEVRDTLYSSGASLAMLSGSGSAIFGLFDNKPPAISLPDGFRQRLLSF